jgi:hypothetical protein
MVTEITIVRAAWGEQMTCGCSICGGGRANGRCCGARRSLRAVGQRKNTGRGRARTRRHECRHSGAAARIVSIPAPTSAALVAAGSRAWGRHAAIRSCATARSGALLLLLFCSRAVRRSGPGARGCCTHRRGALSSHDVFVSRHVVSDVCCCWERRVVVEAAVSTRARNGTNEGVGEAQARARNSGGTQLRRVRARLRPEPVSVPLVSLACAYESSGKGHTAAKGEGGRRAVSSAGKSHPSNTQTKEAIRQPTSHTKGVPFALSFSAVFLSTEANPRPTCGLEKICLCEAAAEHSGGRSTEHSQSNHGQSSTREKRWADWLSSPVPPLCPRLGAHSLSLLCPAVVLAAPLALQTTPLPSRSCTHPTFISSSSQL